VTIPIVWPTPTTPSPAAVFDGPSAERDADGAGETTGCPDVVGASGRVDAASGVRQPDRREQDPPVQRDGEQRLCGDGDSVERQKADDAGERHGGSREDHRLPGAENPGRHLSPRADEKRHEQEAHDDVSDEQRVLGDDADDGASDDDPRGRHEQCRTGCPDGSEHTPDSVGIEYKRRRPEVLFRWRTHRSGASRRRLIGVRRDNSTLASLIPLPPSV
jgi:hypothetical protein